MPETLFNPEKFQFRHMHPGVFLGTASDRYAGWIGQVYSPDRYRGRITRRRKKVGGKTFVEEVLPVGSVQEYFRHFPVLELDFTFYQPLRDKDGRPTQSFRLLRNYRQHLNREDRIILKVPQIICAMKLRQGKAYVENAQYLAPKVFTRQFYEPAEELLDSCLAGFIFEQEYQRKGDRIPPENLATALDNFFSAVPKDPRYHLELRTEAFLSKPVFNVFERHGLGQVLSNWTWLPSLSRQFSHSGCRVLNGDRINVIINNRYGGNAPLTAQQIAKQFVSIISNG